MKEKKGKINVETIIGKKKKEIDNTRLHMVATHPTNPLSRIRTRDHARTFDA